MFCAVFMTVLASVCGASVDAVGSGVRRLILVHHGAVSRSPRPGWPDIAPVRDGAFYGGNIDVPLSERGEAEAKAAADYIATTHAADICAVFSSPMARACYGAEAIATAVATANGGEKLAMSSHEVRRPKLLHGCFRSAHTLHPSNASAICDFIGWCLIV